MGQVGTGWAKMGRLGTGRSGTGRSQQKLQRTFLLLTGFNWKSTYIEYFPGWRVEYCAASDAWTNAPTGLREFFNQRRRWIPSTIANIVNLLEDARSTRKKNSTISYPFIVYQVFLLISTILTPATVVMIIANALHTVLGFTMGLSTAISAFPALMLVLLGFTIKPDNQIIVAGVLCTLYSLAMASVIVSSIIEISHETVASPNGAFLCLLSGTTVIAAFMHPREIGCLFPAPIYLLAIPSGYLILPIYSFCNLHVVSWGTREVESKQKKLDAGENNDNRLTSWQWFQRLCGLFWQTLCTCCPLEKFVTDIESRRRCDAEFSPDIVRLLREINGNLEKIVNNQPDVKLAHGRVQIVDDSETASPLNESPRDVRDVILNGGSSRKRFDRDKSILRKVLAPSVIDETKLLKQHLGSGGSGDSPSSVRFCSPPLALQKSASLGSVYFPSSSSLQRVNAANTDDVFQSMPIIPIDAQSVSSEKIDGSSPMAVSTPRPLRTWITHPSLKDGPVRPLRSEKEKKFWKDLIARYLYPLDKNAKQQVKAASDLKQLRNNVVFGLLMGNAIWILILVQLMTLQERLEPYYIRLPRINFFMDTVVPTNTTENDDLITESLVTSSVEHKSPKNEALKVEPFAFIYLIFFGIILCVQFIAMLIHRWSTVLHLVASCNLRSRSATPVEEMETRRKEENTGLKDMENECASQVGDSLMLNLQHRPANEVLNLIRQLQRPGRFEYEDLEIGSIASLDIKENDEELASICISRYNVQTIGGSSIATRQLHQHGLRDPHLWASSHSTLVANSPGGFANPRATTLGLSFQHRLERLRNVQTTNGQQQRNRLATDC
jgi:hypothetical protein